MNKPTTNRGFIALTSTLAMSLVVATVTAALLYTSAQTRFGIASTEYKEISRAAARACLDEALATLLSNTSYQGNATTTSTVGSCYVYPIDREVSGDTYTIAVRTIAVTSYTTLVATVTIRDVQLSATPANSSRLGTENPSLTITKIREVADY